MNKQLALLTVVATSLLAGCAAGDIKEKGVIGPDPAQAKIAEAATSISHSLVNIAEIQQAATPPRPDFIPPDPAAYGMENLVSVDWSGPVEPLLQQIANSTGYKLRVIGNPPPVPVIITVAARNQQIGDVLRDVSYQAKAKSNIVVFPGDKTIELQYVTG